MNVLLKTSCLVAMTATIVACSDSSSSNRAAGPDPTVDFTSFVKTQIADTGDTREAVLVNKQEFSFNDQNNEQAFDDLFMH
ncbi:hypothetical protein [Marinobacter salicampi]|uniref:hypothetical protein n=1 Tax=Marinobacter salicampi TaxID=435907 RepID=UPI001F5ED70B|nr:hypothetical protein [Marinobacter salicampi]